MEKFSCSVSAVISYGRSKMTMRISAQSLAGLRRALKEAGKNLWPSSFDSRSRMNASDKIRIFVCGSRKFRTERISYSFQGGVEDEKEKNG